MPNNNYKRSRARETKIKNDFESKGYYAVRAAGSKGVADIVAIKPSSCGHANCFEVTFVQVKVSEKIKTENKTIKTQEVPFGLINVEFWKYPVKTNKWYAKFKRKR